MTYRFYVLLILAILLTHSIHSLVAEERRVLPQKDSVADSRRSASGIVLWEEKRTYPEPLAISFARIDLQHPQLEMVVMVGRDPDGDGRAEAILTLPEELMNAYGAIAGINANAFARVKDEDRFRSWYAGMPVDMLGMVATEGVLCSQLENPKRALSEVAFWQTENATGRIERPADNVAPSQAIGDFYGLLLDEGKIVPNAGGTRHPRTAIGLDSSGRYLTMAVVDGRQDGYSVGATLQELANLMKKQGCHRAINLDGGGSSIMMHRDPQTGKLHTLNRPSGKSHRPIPVMLGVRNRT